MTTYTLQNRLQELRAIRKHALTVYKISGALLLVLVGVWIGSIFFASDGGYGTNLYTELLSVAVTILVLDQVNTWRATQQLQKRLIREAGGQSNEAAKAAVDWMHAEGWLTVDGDIQLLKGANLQGAQLQGALLVFANLAGADLGRAHLENAILAFANLAGADLRSANLAGARLDESNLAGADLWDAHLENAILAFANLAGADLRSANLAGADFESAQLQGAILRSANLAGAILKNANLAGADLRSAIFDEKTVLPEYHAITDAPPEYWTPDTDMRRYTDPQHPDFWKPHRRTV